MNELDFEKEEFIRFDEEENNIYYESEDLQDDISWGFHVINDLQERGK